MSSTIKSTIAGSIGIGTSQYPRRPIVPFSYAARQTFAASGCLMANATFTSYADFTSASGGTDASPIDCQQTNAASGIGFIRVPERTQLVALNGYMKDVVNDAYLNSGACTLYIWAVHESLEPNVGAPLDYRRWDYNYLLNVAAACSGDTTGQVPADNSAFPTNASRVISWTSAADKSLGANSTVIGNNGWPEFVFDAAGAYGLVIKATGAGSNNYGIGIKYRFI